LSPSKIPVPRQIRDAKGSVHGPSIVCQATKGDAPVACTILGQQEVGDFGFWIVDFGLKASVR
jgi:hypothetical protein